MDGTNQTAKITDRLKLDELALKVYDRIDRSWQTSPTFTQNLVERVSVSQGGAIGNFEPSINQPRITSKKLLCQIRSNLPKLAATVQHQSLSLR